MRITLNPKGHELGKHCILVCESHEEAFAVEPIIRTEILQNTARPVPDKDRAGHVIYRFNLKWLDRLSLGFPDAELSPGITKRLGRAEEKRLAGMVVPKIRVPGFTGKLYNYQKVALGMLLNGEIDLLNDEMGLGKTFVILAMIAKKRSYPALVLVPNNAKYEWASVIDEFFPEIEYNVYDAQIQSPAERSALIAERAPITIANVEAIRANPIHADPDDPSSPIIDWQYKNPDFFGFKYKVGILDEHHRVKTPWAQATRGFFQVEAERWVGMSGTPILNRPEEIWTVLHKLYPEHFPSYGEFVTNIALKNGDNDSILAYKPDAMLELRDFIRSISLRRRKDQVLKDLPTVVEVKKLVTLGPAQRKLYKEISEDLKLRMDSGEIRNIGGALPHIIRMKQACASTELYGGTPHSAKLDQLKEDVAQLVASGEKAIIFSQWSTMTRIIERELIEYNPVYVTGEVRSLKKRKELANEFNHNPDRRLYIGTIDANREAINLGAATYVFFIDEGWTPGGQDQAVGRSAAGGLRGVHLPKGTKVHVVIYRAEKTYEERIEKLLQRKRNISDRLIDRDGGKQIEKITLADLRDIL